PSSLLALKVASTHPRLPTYLNSHPRPHFLPSTTTKQPRPNPWASSPATKKGPTYRYKIAADQDRAGRRLLHNLNAGNVDLGGRTFVPGQETMMPDENGVPVFVEYMGVVGGEGCWKQPVMFRDMQERLHREKADRKSRGKKVCIKPPCPQPKKPYERERSSRHPTHQAPASNSHFLLAQTRFDKEVQALQASKSFFSHTNPTSSRCVQPHEPLYTPRHHTPSHAFPAPFQHWPTDYFESQTLSQFPPQLQQNHHTTAQSIPDPLVTQQGPLGMYGKRAYVPGQTELQRKFTGSQTDPQQRYEYLAELDKLRKENERQGRGGWG
ncbi:hypothetical protein IAQ61_011814, partial [Plenodomus lingam]|uniref:uncharacterized protein n=1 Tax=Leptosphaeria maculans TaxID=5022 RepID=UPI003316574E